MVEEPVAVNEAELAVALEELEGGAKAVVRIASRASFSSQVTMSSTPSFSVSSARRPSSPDTQPSSAPGSGGATPEELGHAGSR